MAKNKFDETFELDEDVKINPESEEKMDNEKAFYDEDKAEEPDDLEDSEESDKEDHEDKDPDDGKEKTGIKGKIARHKKGLIIGGIVTGVLIVGGIVVYKAGKKPVKMDALDEITDILKDKNSEVADVIDFADAVKPIDKAV